MFSFTVTPTIQKEGKVVGQAAAPPVLTTPPRSRVLCSGRPPTGRGNQVCVFSRPGAGRSAAPPRARPAELPAAARDPQMRLRLFSSLTRVLLSTKQTVDSQG